MEKPRCAECHLALNPKNAKPVMVYGKEDPYAPGKEHYFCSDSCEALFTGGFYPSEED